MKSCLLVDSSIRLSISVMADSIFPITYCGDFDSSPLIMINTFLIHIHSYINKCHNDILKKHCFLLTHPFYFLYPLSWLFQDSPLYTGLKLKLKACYQPFWDKIWFAAIALKSKLQLRKLVKGQSFFTHIPMQWKK